MRLPLTLLSTALIASTAFAQPAGTTVMSPAGVPMKTVPVGAPVMVPLGTANASGPMGGPAGGPPPMGPMFDTMDTNRDGTVSKQEFLAHAEEHFNRMDTNHDGKLTREEMEAARPPMPGDHGSPAAQGGPGGMGMPMGGPGGNPAPASIPSAVPVPPPAH